MTIPDINNIFGDLNMILICLYSVWESMVLMISKSHLLAIHLIIQKPEQNKTRARKINNDGCL